MYHTDSYVLLTETTSMKTLLRIISSPRGTHSNSLSLADYFTQHLMHHGQGWQVKDLNLWEHTLPPMDMTATSAKYAIMHGQALNVEQQHVWLEIKHYFRTFIEADAIALVLPIWNFNIPYVLKHYVDVITQPGFGFTWDPETGYTPLIESKRCVIISSSGSDYRVGAGHEEDDFSLRYLERWLTVYFGYAVDQLTFSPTAQDPIGVEQEKQRAFEQAYTLSKIFN